MSIVFHQKEDDVELIPGNTKQTEFSIINQTNQVLRLSYYFPDGGLSPYIYVPPGGKISQQTTSRHLWLVESIDNEIEFKFYPSHSGDINVYPSYQEFNASEVSIVTNGWSSIWGYGIPDLIKALGLTKKYEKLPKNLQSNNEILNLLNVPAAWSAGFTGTGVKVAVLDTGIIEHGEIIVSHRWNVTEKNSDTSTPESYTNRLHGISVASPIAAKYEKEKNESGARDITGVAPDVELIDIKITTGSIGGSTNQLILDGVIYAVDQGARVIQVSQGGTDATLAAQVLEAVEYAYTNGSLVVFPASNEGDSGPTGPATSVYLNKSIAVGNFDLDTMQPFVSSNTAGNYPTAFLFAPSSGFYPNSEGDYYFIKDGGTSYASSYISGMAALIFEKYPKATVSQVISLLTESAWQPSIGQNAIFDIYGNRLIEISEFDESVLSPSVTDIVVVSGTSEMYEYYNHENARILRKIDTSLVAQITGVDRIQFDNEVIAFDIDGQAGDAIELIHALTGTMYLGDKEVIGQAIALLDTSLSRNDVAKTAIDVILGDGWSDYGLIEFAVSNVYGGLDTTALTQSWTNLKERHGLTSYDIFWSIAESSQAHQNLDFVGISNSGLAYIPFF